MNFIKNNIKLIIFIFVILLIAVAFTLFVRRKVSYSVEYDKDGYHIIESYNKDLGIYKFSVIKDDYKYDYVYNHKYLVSKRLISDINQYDKDEYKCLSIKVFDNSSQVVCTNGKDYYDEIINTVEDGVELSNSDEFIIYNNNHDYLIWNGYGFTNKTDGSTYNFLTHESYSNDLYYQFDNYILVADYDQKHKFNKIYIYDNKKKKVDTFELKRDISYDSYFMGNIGEDVFLFDASSKIQYQLNIKKKRIRISTSKDRAVYFDKNKTDILTNKLYYNKVLFKNDKLYNYSLLNNQLYYNTYDSNNYVKISNINKVDLIYSDGYNAYIISDNTLYKVNPSIGTIRLANYFEWNFDYLNKVFVFSR